MDPRITDITVEPVTDSVTVPIGYVDVVTVKNLSDEKWSLIKIVKPDVLVVSERTEHSEAEREELKEWCGSIVVLESQATTSTTAQIRLLIMGVVQETKENINKLEEDIRILISNVRKFLDQLPGGVTGGGE